MKDANRRISVSVFGAAGRMGSAVVKALAQEPDIDVRHLIERNETAGVIVEEIQTEMFDTPSRFNADVWVDVSLGSAAFEHALEAEKLRIPILLGATGFSDTQTKRLHQLRNAHIIAPNLSVGVNMLFDIAPKIRKILGGAYDVALIDTHHKHKLDAPSGTAKRLAEGLNAEGEKPVQVVSLRVGEVVGEHKIVFAVDGEEIELIHRAESRMAFARGVAPAVRFLSSKTNGEYSMKDVLGL